MTAYKKLAFAFGGDNIHPCGIGFGEDFKLGNAFNILFFKFGVP